jgi:hypothetical protein
MNCRECFQEYEPRNADDGFCSDSCMHRYDKELTAVPCVSCGEPVEEVRHCYVQPTCYDCLPPPEPLETI